MGDFLFCMNVGEWYCKVLWNFHFVLKKRDLKVDLLRKFKCLKKKKKLKKLNLGVVGRVGGIQGLLLALYSGISPGGVWGNSMEFQA